MRMAKAGAKKTKTLKISNCLECPRHGTERDPSSGDSFDWIYEHSWWNDEESRRDV